MAEIVKWNGREAQDFIRRQIVMALKRACVEIVRKAKELLSVSGTGSLITGHVAKDSTGRRNVVGAHLIHSTNQQGDEFASGANDLLIQRKMKGGPTKTTVYGGFPSEPGEPPHKQTGQLRMSVTYEIDERAEIPQARVGTNLLYGLFLELGTRRGLKPRPWLRRAAYESRERVDLHLSE